MKKAVLREKMQTDQQLDEPIISKAEFIEQVTEQPKTKKLKDKKAVTK